VVVKDGDVARDDSADRGIWRGGLAVLLLALLLLGHVAWISLRPRFYQVDLALGKDLLMFLVLIAGARLLSRQRGLGAAGVGLGAVAAVLAAIFTLKEMSGSDFGVWMGDGWPQGLWMVVYGAAFVFALALCRRRGMRMAAWTVIVACGAELAFVAAVDFVDSSFPRVAIAKSIWQVALWGILGGAAMVDLGRGGSRYVRVLGVLAAGVGMVLTIGGLFEAFYTALFLPLAAPTSRVDMSAGMPALLMAAAWGAFVNGVLQLRGGRVVRALAWGASGGATVATLAGGLVLLEGESWRWSDAVASHAALLELTAIGCAAAGVRLWMLELRRWRETTAGRVHLDCPHCGARVEVEGDDRCSTCGLRIRVEARQLERAGSTAWRAAVWTALVVDVLVLLVIGVIAWSSARVAYEPPSLETLAIWLLVLAGSGAWMGRFPAMRGAALACTFLASGWLAIHAAFPFDRDPGFSGWAVTDSTFFLEVVAAAIVTAAVWRLRAWREARYVLALAVAGAVAAIVVHRPSWMLMLDFSHPCVRMFETTVCVALLLVRNGRGKWGLWRTGPLALGCITVMYASPLLEQGDVTNLVARCGLIVTAVSAVAALVGLRRVQGAEAVVQWVAVACCCVAAVMVLPAQMPSSLPVLPEPVQQASEQLWPLVAILATVAMAGWILLPPRPPGAGFRGERVLGIQMPCPGCKHTLAATGEEGGCGCGWKVWVTVEEPRCATCGYLRYYAASDVCPECRARG
jgi:hypothetical protein